MEKLEFSKKGGTFMQIPNQNNKLELIEASRKIRKGFCLKRKEDL